MAFQDKKGHFTEPANDGGECHHQEKLKALITKYNTDGSGTEILNAVNNYKTEAQDEPDIITTLRETKIKGIHIDFQKDNILPKLNPEDLLKMQINKNKLVLLKKSILINNGEKHKDVKQDEIPFLIGEALYDSDDIVKGKNPNANYYSFVKLMEKSDKKGNKMFGVVLLDVNETNEYFEIVHWHWVRQKSIKSI